MKNGKITKSLILLVLTVCTAALAAGCSTFDSFRHSFIDRDTEADNTAAVPTITIGVLDAQTGNTAEKGRAVIKGIELANSIYNNVNGYKVILSKVDTQSSVSAASTAVQGLISMKPAAIIGCSGEATSLVISDYIKEAKIPAITPAATNPLSTQSNEYYFRACITESQMGAGLAEYACRELGSRNIGIISLKNDSSAAAVLDGFGDEIARLVGKRSKAVAFSTELTGSGEELQAAVRKLKKKNCDVCFVALGRELMDQFFSYAEEEGLSDVVFLGSKSWGSTDFAGMMSKHKDIKAVFPYVSVLSGSSQATESQTEEAQRFQIEYSAKYGSEDIPSEYSALGYDAYLLVINAIHNSVSLEGRDVRDALMNTKDLRGVTGIFSFDSAGNVVRTVTLSAVDRQTGQIAPEYVTKSEAEAKELENIESQQETEE